MPKAWVSQGFAMFYQGYPLQKVSTWFRAGGQSFGTENWNAKNPSKQQNKTVYSWNSTLDFCYSTRFQITDVVLPLFLQALSSLVVWITALESSTIHGSNFPKYQVVWILSRPQTTLPIIANSQCMLRAQTPPKMTLTIFLWTGPPSEEAAEKICLRPLRGLDSGRLTGLRRKMFTLFPPWISQWITLVMLVIWTHVELVSGQQKEEEGKKASLSKTGHKMTYMQSPSCLFHWNSISREIFSEWIGLDPLARSSWWVEVQLGWGVYIFCTDRRHSHNASLCICHVLHNELHMNIHCILPRYTAKYGPKFQWC